MEKLYLCLIFVLFSFLTSKAQITVNATAGQTSSSYTSLKSAFDAINNGEHQGDITILVNGSVTESATAKLNAGNGTGLTNYTSVVLRPTGAYTITGNMNGPVIDLNGADSVIIDGRIDGTGDVRSLTVQNTYVLSTSISSVVSSAIRLMNGANSNIIRFVKVESSGGAGIHIAGADVASNDYINSNNLIDNNDVGAYNGVGPSVCIYSRGTASLPWNTNTVISNNLVHDFRSTDQFSSASGISVGSNSYDFTITGNSLYQTYPVVTTKGYSYNYIDVLGSTVINDNFIGGTAPHAGGTPAIYDGPMSIKGIVFVLGGSAKVDGNIMRNISMSNPYSDKGGIGFVGISGGAGNFEIGVVKGNVIGSLTEKDDIIITNTLSSAGITGISFLGGVLDNRIVIRNNTIGSFTVNSTSTQPASIAGISMDVYSSINIQNNIIGGTVAKSMQLNARSGMIRGIKVAEASKKSQINVSQNTIQNFYNNCTGTESATVAGIHNYLEPYNGNISQGTIADNKIINLQNVSAATIDGSVRGIYLKMLTASAVDFINTNIRNNEISNLSAENNSESTVVAGIDNEAPFNLFMNIDSNNIHHLKNTAPNFNTFSLAAVQGIRYLASANASANIIGNKIHDLESTTSAASWVTGINLFYSAGNNVMTVSGNYLYNFSNNNSLTGGVAGVHIKGVSSTGSFVVSNNMIALKAAQVSAYGIMNSATATQLALYYNTVVIGGSATGNNNSAAVYRTASTNTNVILNNNILYNTRQGGTGGHYALINEHTTPGTGWKNSNYNNFYSTNPANVVLWGSAPLSFGNYVNIAQLDTCSTSTTVDFADISNNDLHLLDNDHNHVLAGKAVAGITTDFDGDPRHPNPAMGADEIIIPVTLPLITASGPLSFCKGAQVTLTSSIGTAVQWYRNGTVIPDATGATYIANKSGAYTIAYTNGCMQVSSLPVQVSVGNEATYGMSIKHVFCHGDTTAAVNLIVNGDDTNLTYKWNNGATTEDLYNVVAGDYKVVISDVAGCKDSMTATVTEPTEIVLSATHTDQVCLDWGSIDLTVTGGVLPYTIGWEFDGRYYPVEDRPSVSAGVHTAYVTDANKCKKELVVTVAKIPCEEGKYVTVYPNPVSDVVNVKVVGYYQNNVPITIYNVYGEKKREKRIHTSNQGTATFDVQSLPSGLYLIVVDMPDEKIQRWFVK